MTTIATLGPANTFSELAAIKYGEESGGEFGVEMPAAAENDGGAADQMNMRPLQPTPFSDDRSNPHVLVAAGEGAYDNTREVLSQINLAAAVKGKRVLLKPNAGRIATAESGITTNPQVVAAVIDVFLEAEASVAVGESPITGVKTMEAFEATGIASVARERNCPLINISRIQVNPDMWHDFSSPFEPPPKNLSIQFPGITLLDEQSCSACQSTVLMFLKRYREQVFDSYPGQENVTIAIGKRHQSVPRGTLCIGNCTAQHKKQGVFVAGCPPVATQILEMISESDPEERPNVQIE